jgi:hypothetical protein
MALSVTQLKEIAAIRGQHLILTIVRPNTKWHRECGLTIDKPICPLDDAMSSLNTDSWEDFVAGKLVAYDQDSNPIPTTGDVDWTKITLLYLKTSRKKKK